MKNTTAVGIVLALSIAFFSAEVSIGFKTKSLALIADAFHYLNDIVAYAIAFTAAYLQERGQHTNSFTYAFHRAELVGAFFNGVFLLALALSICLQSLERFVNVEVVDSPKLVLIIGCVGLGLNILSAIVVHDHHGHGHGHGNATDPFELRTMNIRRDQSHATHNHRLERPINTPQHNLGLIGVLTHLVGDAINNIGVIIAAIIFMKLSSPKRFYADPAVSLAISFIIFGGSIPMTLKTGRILLEASPRHLDLAKVKEDLLSTPDVLSVHDLHVWHLSQSVILASLHVCIPLGTSIEEWETTERYLQHCFEEYGINHVTISPEIQKDPETITQLTEDTKDSCRLPSHNDYGCAVNELKKRKVTGA
ncbi:CDF zinc transporter [Gymnopilus junonius]|uniref:CDF zinc transporter n=1 Tax=Gymnopilus junonius TaxID=109634 RepID=A0A9P5NV23_GYMJU|nr:CDF zinc transporter [Gymnopilus junonius]